MPSSLGQRSLTSLGPAAVPALPTPTPHALILGRATVLQTRPSALARRERDLKIVFCSLSLSIPSSCVHRGALDRWACTGQPPAFLWSALPQATPSHAPPARGPPPREKQALSASSPLLRLKCPAQPSLQGQQGHGVPGLFITGVGGGQGAGSNPASKGKGGTEGGELVRVTLEGNSESWQGV